MFNILIGIQVILFVALLFCGVMLVRNNMIYDIRIQRIHYIFHEDHPCGETWEELYHDFHNGKSYEDMMWSLTKWKYSDFYTECKVK